MKDEGITNFGRASEGRARTHMSIRTISTQSLLTQSHIQKYTLTVIRTLTICEEF